MDLSAFASPALLSTAMFGNALYQYLQFFAVVLLFVLLSKVVYYLFKNQIRRYTEKTNTKFDDILVEILEHPLTMLVIVLGVYISNTMFLVPNTAPHDFIGAIVSILIIINIAWLVLRLVDTMIVFYIRPFVEKSETELDDQLLPILRKGTKLIIIVLTILFILGNFGYDITTLLAGLGVGGLAVALAAQDTVSNFIGSVIIFSDKPFKIKDFIKFGGNMGTVKEVGIRSTKLETPSGTILVVPNSKLSSEIVENFSQAKTRRIEQTIGITYDTGYKKMENAIKMLEKIAESHKNVIKYDVKFVEFGAYSLNINMRYWIKDTSKYRETQHEINMEVKRKFDKQKIDMAFPTQTIYLNK